MGGGGECPLTVFVRDQMDEGIVHRSDQIEGGPQDDFPHVSHDQGDVRSSGEPPPGHCDHLRRQIEGHDKSGRSGEAGGGPAGAGSELEDTAARGSRRRPSPKVAITTIRQLEIVEWEDAAAASCRPRAARAS